MTLSGYVYVCSAGETFDSVALSVYGDEQYAADLLCANPDKDAIWMFEGGEILKLPKVEATENDGEIQAVTTAPWKR